MKKLFRKINENKNFIIPFCILTVSIIIFAGGVSYAYFLFSVEKTYVSSLRVTGADYDILVAGDKINVTGAYPIYDEYKDSQANTYEFTITNRSAKIGACYDIVLQVTQLSAGLQNSFFRWELVNETNNTVTSGNFNNVGTIDEVTLEDDNSLIVNQSVSYTLKIWLSYSETEDQSAVQNGVFAGNINVSAKSEACGKLAISYYEAWQGSQPFVASSDGVYLVQLWGAQGGSYNSSLLGGYGAYTEGKIELQKGDKLYIQIGEQPDSLTSGTTYYHAGGYNGGGTGGNNSGTYAQGGGGSTDIRLKGGAWNDSESLNSRIMVAAGGGGTTSVSNTLSGNAGGLTGYYGTASSGTFSTSTYYSYGGTQTSGGTGYGSGRNGLFGMALQATAAGYGGGGGGGYYGGAKGYGTGGGGGSSYISGHAGSLAIASSTSTSLKSGCTSTSTTVACSTHYSGEYFTDTKMIDGSGYNWTTSKGSLTTMSKPDQLGNYSSGTGNTGNGHARITLLEKYPVKVVAYNGTVSGGYTATNLITNSSFESNTSNWTSATTGSLAQKASVGVGKSTCALVTSAGTDFTTYSNSFSLPIGDNIYVKAYYLKKYSGKVQIQVTDRASGNGQNLEYASLTGTAFTWKSISLKDKNNSSVTTFNLDLSSSVNTFMAWDNIIAINLNDVFGNNYIPNKSWLDKNLPYINGSGSFNSNEVIYDGSVSFTITPTTGYSYASHTCLGQYDTAVYSSGTLTLTGVKSEVECSVTYSS